jgi:cell division protein FtsQ
MLHFRAIAAGSGGRGAGWRGRRDVEWRVAGGRNRRRVDRGAEAEAGGPRRSVRALALLSGLALLAGLAVLGPRALGALRSAEALRIRTIRFEGLERATADELLALSPVKPGDHLLSADVDAMAQALARHPWLRRVEVHRSWPPALTVRLQERRAAALVELSGLYLVDEAGEVFKRAAPGDGLDLPLVTGLARAEYVQRRASFEPRLQGALALVRAWREGRGEAAGRLSEIHVEADGATIYVGDEGTQVRLGTGDLEEKLARLEQVLSALRAEGKRAEVLHLDNRIHPSWVTVRLAGVTSPGAMAVGGP